MKKMNLLLGCLSAALIMGLSVPVLAASGNRTAGAVYEHLKLFINGKEIVSTDGNGTALTPVVIDGVTYLPALSVGNALNMDISLDATNKTITLTNRIQSTSTNTSDYIGVEKAKSIALVHAGVAAKDVTFYKAELDQDDGYYEYEIEFYSKNKEYDYKIDPVSGAVLKWDTDVEGHEFPPSTDNSNYISVEKAKALAQAKAPDAAFVSFELDHDDGKAVYEGELKQGRTEYDFKIDAVTGNFLKWESDYDD